MGGLIYLDLIEIIQLWTFWTFFLTFYLNHLSPLWGYFLDFFLLLGSTSVINQCFYKHYPSCNGGHIEKEYIYMSHFASACKTEGQNGISRLISELLHTLDSSLRDLLFVLQNEVSELPNHAAC